MFHGLNGQVWLGVTILDSAALGDLLHPHSMNAIGTTRTQGFFFHQSGPLPQAPDSWIHLGASKTFQTQRIPIELFERLLNHPDSSGSLKAHIPSKSCGLHLKNRPGI